MTATFHVTPRAASDLDAIARYTSETWGVEQLNDYLLALEDRFRWLAENPLLGRDRSDIEPGYRSYPQGSHLIFYVVQSDAIAIIALPHKSMDVDAFFV